MTAPRPVDRYLPRYEQLREHMGELRLPTLNPFDTELDLLSLEADGTAEMAAVVMRTRLLVRQEWSDIVELSTATFDAIDTAAPAVPRSDDPTRFDKREHRYRMHDARRQPCTMCTPIQRGRVFCGVCRGTGQRAEVDEANRLIAVPCGSCLGGLAQCPTCEGTGESIVAEIHYATDSLLEDRRVVVPTLHGDLDDRVRAIVESITTLPDELRIDLEPTVVTSAYRGSIGVETPSLFGFDYMDAYELARSQIVASPENALLRQDEVWGWPFLCVRYTINGKEIDVAIVADGAGKWRAVFDGPPLVRTP